MVLRVGRGKWVAQDMTTSPLNALAARLESVDALDGPGRTAGRAVRALIPDGAPKNVLSGAWLGHAVHPILTDIPIVRGRARSFWTGSADKVAGPPRTV